MEIAVTSASAKSLTTLAFERLRADILSGQLRPEERLRIQGLSERYSIGATAIREALSRLVTDGLVESEDQRGFCVAPVSRDELIDLTQTRVEIECLALRHAIERGNLDWESNLLSGFHRLSKTPPPTSLELHAGWATVHRQFHEALLAGCNSSWTLRLCRLLYDKSERYRNLAEQHTASMQRDTITEHRDLMDAAMGRDPELATRLLSSHFWATAEITLRAAFGGAR
ncbi:FCD domain-containing protein [Sphaerotilus sp.]|uniref:GntR family transcriptional regulator n=1 Tax=Sphaerotilus sp. TaxID=2093942 RepID=UPI00286D8C7F|nr:FCD domain-containing protein [Sphaerotilus sp.]